MNKTRNTLFFAFSEPDILPEFIQLLPAGEFRSADGRGPLRVRSVPALIQAFNTLGKIPVDEVHSTDLAGPKGQPAPAVGWIVALENRNGEIWGRVEWNNRGRALLEDKAYRGISPVLMQSKSGDISQIIRAALTNDPAITQIKTLHSHAKDDPMPIINQLLAAAGLPEGATEAELLNAVTSQFQFVSDARKASGVTDAESFEPVLKVLNSRQNKDHPGVSTDLVTEAEEAAGLQKGAGLEASIKALCANSKNAGDERGEFRKTILSLQTRLSEVEHNSRKAEAEHFIDEAIKAGKPVRPLRDDYIARFCKEPDVVKKEINSLPSINDGGVVNPRKDGDVHLTSEDEHMIAAFGYDRDAYIKHKKELGGQS